MIIKNVIVGNVLTIGRMNGISLQYSPRFSFRSVPNVKPSGSLVVANLAEEWIIITVVNKPAESFEKN